MSTAETEFFERVREVLGFVMAKWPMRGRYIKLEEMTGVSARKWTMFWNRQMGATTEVLLAVAKLKPDAVEWMLLGTTSVEVQRSSPVDFDEQDAELTHVPKKWGRK